jgi:hypothetical protein
MTRPSMYQLGIRREQLVNAIKMAVEREDWNIVISHAIQIKEIEAQLTMMD